MPHFQIDAPLLFLILSQKLGLKPRPYRTALLAEVKTLNVFHYVTTSDRTLFYNILTVAQKGGVKLVNKLCIQVASKSNTDFKNVQLGRYVTKPFQLVSL